MSRRLFVKARIIRIPPFLKLNRRNDCGAVALANIARHYGISIELQQVRDLLGTNGVGTNLYDLLKAANALGFSSMGVRGPYSALERIPFPAIAHVTMDGLGHFVVVHSWDPAFVRISDRCGDVRNEDREEFCNHWSGYLLIAVPETVTEKKLLQNRFTVHTPSIEN